MGWDTFRVGGGSDLTTRLACDTLTMQSGEKLSVRERFGFA